MTPGCTFEGGCDRPFVAKGYCGGHYRQARETGALKPLRRASRVQTCRFEDCDEPGIYVNTQTCRKHYQRVTKGVLPPTRANQGAPMHLRPPPTTAGGMHHRPKELWGSASGYPCVECGHRARDWAYDGTDPGCLFLDRQRCSQWPEFYMPMCKKCHTRRDGAMAAQELYEYRLWKHLNPDKTLAMVS